MVANQDLKIGEFRLLETVIFLKNNYVKVFMFGR